jgi:hypothetical protein
MIVSFDVRGDATAADAVCAKLELIQHAISLGAVESTIERRASIPGQEHLPPMRLRLSVGIEAVEDLWADLDRALRSAPKSESRMRSPRRETLSPWISLSRAKSALWSGGPAHTFDDVDRRSYPRRAGRPILEPCFVYTPGASSIPADRRCRFHPQPQPRCRRHHGDSSPLMSCVAALSPR